MRQPPPSYLDPNNVLTAWGSTEAQLGLQVCPSCLAAVMSDFLAQNLTPDFLAQKLMSDFLAHQSAPCLQHAPYICSTLVASDKAAQGSVM